MIDEVKINGTDVTAYRMRWAQEAEEGIAVDLLEIAFKKSVTDIADPVVGSEITVRRGFSAVTEDYVFEGIITQRNPQASKINVVAKGMLVEAIKSRQTYSWDYDIDTEAGQGSELFKAHCDNAGLYYDSDSIIATGTGSGDIIKKWIQNDEDDLQKMNGLKDIFDYSVKYVPRNTGTGRVFFEPRGYGTYPTILNVGTEIVGQIKWTENMEKLINQVKIKGATVYDKVAQTGSGPTLTLTKTPEDTELRVENATGTLLVRGVKDVGVQGTDYNYYVDAEQKKVFLPTGSGGTFWIRYGAQVPMPVILKNQTSIDAYGGPNSTPTTKSITINEIKYIGDAEKKGRAILAKFSTPFNEAENIPIADSVLQTQFIKPGNMLNIVDSYNDKDVNVVAKIVQKSFPHVSDKITVGDEIWRTADWDSKVSEKLNQLFNELNKNQDILTSILDVETENTHESRYFTQQTKDRSASGSGLFILGHPDFGVLGNQELGDDATTFVTINIIQGNNTYKEFMNDSDFEGTTGSGSAVWDTTNERLELGPGAIHTLGVIALGTSYDYFTYTYGAITGTGDNITAYISADAEANYTALTNTVRTNITDTGTGGVYIKYINTGTGTGYIANTYTAGGKYDSPTITLKMEES